MYDIRRDLVAVIAFAHHKGGTGKTTSCLQVAGFLVKSGRRVLVVDTDPQANATLGLGIHPGTPGRNIYHLYTAYSDSQAEQISMSDLIVRTVSGIDLVPSHLDLVGAEPVLYQIPNRYEILSKEIEPLKARYDHILIDTPPFLGQFVLNGLIAADLNILVFSPDSFALNGYENIRLILSDIEEILGNRITIDMAILNRWNHSSEPSLFEKIGLLLDKIRPKDIESQNDLKHLLEEKVRKDINKIFMVPESRLISVSNRNGIPLAFSHAEDPAAKSYALIAEAIEMGMK